MNDHTDKVFKIQRVQKLLESKQKYTDVLRNWLVGLGIGVPALFISQEQAWKALSASNEGWPLALLYFSGIGLQVFQVLLSKYAVQYGYIAHSIQA